MTATTLTAGGVLNLGCGTKTSDDPSVLNVDWSPMLRIRQNPVLRRCARLLLSGERLERYEALPSNLLVRDLSKGLPFPDGSASAAFHSHVLEHIDRSDAPGFFADVLRVLRPGGIHRAVVPDFEKLARDYLGVVNAVDAGSQPPEASEEAIADIILQMVRRMPAGTSAQPRLRRRVEMLLLGDARRRGETHQWMYDRRTLVQLFEQCGFVDVKVCSWGESSIPGWRSLGLEEGEPGQEYRPGSIYVEGAKPLEPSS